MFYARNILQQDIVHKKMKLMTQIIVFSRMVESEMVMFTNNWINYDVKDTWSSQFFCETQSDYKCSLFYKTLV